MRNTDKQIRYAMHLLGKAGYSTRFMNAKFKELGATMSERGGSVEGWLTEHSNISGLIDKLKESS